MPTYEYRCEACDDHFEAVQKFSDAPIKECKHCGGPVRKLISPVGVIFKGPGFHVNDYRKPEAKKSSIGESATKTTTTTPKTETSTSSTTPPAPPSSNN